jgi:hypothetical protein
VVSKKNTRRRTGSRSSLANGLPHELFLIGDDGDLDLYRVDVGIADEALDVAPCAHG